MITAATIISEENAAEANMLEEITDSSNWHPLSSLPDSIGFGGMFAGKIEELLVAGGGSQFRDKPAWLGGKKSFSDRIFTLKRSDAQWCEHAARLPQASGHFASACHEKTIYVVGGISDEGCLATCYALRMRGADLIPERMPDLPQPLAYAAAVIAHGILYVAGGQSSIVSSKPSRQMWVFDIKNAKSEWMLLPALPGPGVIVPCMASDGESIYLFGGMAIDEDGNSTPSRRAYSYKAFPGGEWERLPDMPESRVGAATPCPDIGGDGFLLIGGYSEVYAGSPRDYPGFSARTLVYRRKSKTWEEGPSLPRRPFGDRDVTTDPGPVPVVAAPCVEWNGMAVVIGGETRPAARTPSVIAFKDGCSEGGFA